MIPHSDFEEHCARLFVKPETKQGKFLHACVGIAGEAGELLDAIKKHWIYGKALDSDNVIEECGDLLFYLAMAARQLGVPLHHLSGRLPRAGSDTALALVRDVSFIHKCSGELLDVANDWYAEEVACVGKVEFVREASRLYYEIESLLVTLGFTMQDAYAANVAKLSKRYPAGYTNDAAIARADKGGEAQ